MSEPPPNCSYCGVRLVVVRVHGHGQCAHCGTNVEPCCAGASPEDASAQGSRPELDADPLLFRRVFRHLGSERDSIEREALVFAVGQWLGLALDEALIVVDAGVHTGKLLTAGPAAYRLPDAA